MKKIFNMSRKTLMVFTMILVLTVGFVVPYQITSKPIEAKAHVVTPHPYPGYLIKYNPTWYDDNVKVIQICLNSHTPDEHYYNVGVVDGFFGSKTLEMVKRFQSDHGLYVDGVVGPQTWNAIVYETLCP